MRVRGLLPRLRMVLGLLALGLLVVAACRSGEEEKTALQGAGGQFAGSVKIGAVFDASGPVGGAPLALSQVLGIERAIQDINTEGGVTVKGQRYRLELLKADSRSQAVDAVAAAQQVIQERVLASAVLTCPFFNQAYEQLRSTGSVLVWTFCPPGDILLNKDSPRYEGIEKHPLLFNAIDFADFNIIGWMRQAKKLHPEIRRVSFLVDDGQLGRSMAPTVEKGARELGLEFLGGVFYPVGTTDFAPYITNVKGKNPDLVYSGTGGGAGVELPVAAVELNMAPYIIIPGMRPVDVQKIRDLGNITLIMTDFRLPYYKAVAPKEYAQKVDHLGLLPSGFEPTVGAAVTHYDFVRLLVKAMEKAGTVDDAKAVAQAMVGLSIDSFLGGNVIVLDDHSIRGSMGNIEVTKNKFTLYTYKDARTDSYESRHEVPR